MSLFTFLGFRDIGPNPSSSIVEDTETMRRIVSKLEALPKDRARYLAAFAYILGRAAYADASVSAQETEKMLEIVQVLGQLPKSQATLVVEIATNQVRLFGGTDNFLVSRLFKEMSLLKQRLELLECVFAVSAADESITVIEEGQARQISSELGLTHEQFLIARSGFIEHIEALKNFRKQRT